jgi:Na+-translocating ferredoxin:NAD+ oxidoreductase subunit B
MDNYEKLRKILDCYMSGAPASPTIDEILRTLFTEDEVGIAVHMSFRPKKTEEIAQAAAVPLDEAEKHLNAMADKCIIVSPMSKKGKVYSLLPTVPGLFEVPLNRFRRTPMGDRLAALWSRYNEEAMIESLSGKPTPQMRVIPVESTIPRNSHVFPYEVVSDLIRRSGTIGVLDCACRVSEKRCDNPVDVCLILGSMAELAIERSLARKLTAEEAITVLDKTEAAGLVHCGDNCADKANIICSCCACCCHALRGLTEFGYTNAIGKSSYEAAVNEAECMGCGICHEKRCPVKAIVLEDEKAKVLPGKCIGCGLCASACPTEAIELRKRENYPETPATTQDLGLKILTEKGKLDAFMELIMK